MIKALPKGQHSQNGLGLCRNNAFNSMSERVKDGNICRILLAQGYTNKAVTVRCNRKKDHVSHETCRIENVEFGSGLPCSGWKRGKLSTSIIVCAETTKSKLTTQIDNMPKKTDRVLVVMPTKTRVPQQFKCNKVHVMVMTEDVIGCLHVGLFVAIPPEKELSILEDLGVAKNEAPAEEVSGIPEEDPESWIQSIPTGPKPSMENRIRYLTDAIENLSWLDAHDRAWMRLPRLLDTDIQCRIHGFEYGQTVCEFDTRKIFAVIPAGFNHK
jgi:hypothetical protein